MVLLVINRLKSSICCEITVLGNAFFNVFQLVSRELFENRPEYDTYYVFTYLFTLSFRSSFNWLQKVSNFKIAKLNLKFQYNLSVK